MELSYILTSIIAAIGLFAGIVIGLMAKEEIKPGKRYFSALQNILFSLALLIAVSSYSAEIAITIAAAFLLLLTIKPVLKKNQLIVYSVLGALFYLSAPKNLFMSASIIFLYGLPAGTLMSQKDDWAKKVMIIAIVFILISNVLHLI